MNCSVLIAGGPLHFNWFNPLHKTKFNDHNLFIFAEALQLAIDSCVEKADIYDICQKVDAFIEEELQKTFSSKKSKKLERGIAFPCCISVNEICGHFSPLKEDSYELKMEDLVKVELGAHIDGFPA